MPGTIQPFPLSRKTLRKFAGKDSALYQILDFHALRDVAFEKFDFNIKALDTTNHFTVAAGTASTTWAVRAEPGGWIRGVVNATDAATSGLQLSIPQKYWNGDNNAGMACLFRADTLENVRIEIGFVNALPSVNTTIVNNTTTPTYNTSTSAALYLYSKTGTAAAITGLYTAGTSMTSAALAITTVPTATTPFFVAIQTIGDNVYLWGGDSPRPLAQTATATRFEGGDGLIPVVSLKSNETTSACNFDIDFLCTWSGRLG